MGVAVHIGMIHAHEGDYEVKEMLTKDMEDKAVVRDFSRFFLDWTLNS